MVPDVSYNEAYISYLFTHPDWRGAGIAKFMLYHLIMVNLFYFYFSWFFLCVFLSIIGSIFHWLTLNGVNRIVNTPKVISLWLLSLSHN